MTTPNTYAVCDALTGEAFPVRHGSHYIKIGEGRGQFWLTPSAALHLARDLLDAADALTPESEVAETP